MTLIGSAWLLRNVFVCFSALSQDIIFMTSTAFVEEFVKLGPSFQVIQIYFSLHFFENGLVVTPTGWGYVGCWFQPQRLQLPLTPGHHKIYKK